MRWVSLFGAVMMLLFGLVQLNDPDPALWIAIYGYTALLCFMGFLNRFYPLWAVVGFVLFLAGAIYLFPSNYLEWIQAEEQAKSLEMRMPFVEEARESLGLLICCAMMLLHFFQYRKLRKIS